MIISHGKGVMYFSRLFLLNLEFFAWKIVIFPGMDNLYYYLRRPISALRKKTDLDHQRFFPDISSPANIWNMSDDKSD